MKKAKQQPNPKNSKQTRSGTAVTEYAVMLGLIAVIAIVSIRLVGDSSSGAYEHCGNELGNVFDEEGDSKGDSKSSSDGSSSSTPSKTMSGGASSTGGSSSSGSSSLKSVEEKKARN